MSTMMTIFASLGSVVAVSLVSLIGLATLSMNQARVRRLATFFVSFAVGALLGDAFIHLIPATFQESQMHDTPLAGSLLILGGIMLFFVVEKLIQHRHGILHAQHHADRAAPPPALAVVNLVGDGIHNLIDGVLIGASYLAGPKLGVATTIAVLLHEIPQELGDFAILVHSGVGVRKAVFFNLASASIAIVGTIVALLVGTVAKDAAIHVLLPVAAGGFVYLAAADLIPELQHDRSLRSLIVQATLICLGIATMGLLVVIE